MFPRPHLLLASLLLFTLTGCATYEYDIVRPPDLRLHVFHDRDLVIQRAPLEYRLRAYEDRLVVRIYNSTQDTLKLVGDQSTVVDPTGQSHPLRGTAILPGTYIKLILPPAPHIEPAGPSVTFGMTYGVGYWHHPYYGPYWYGGYPYWNEPRYIVVYEAGESYWTWHGETDVRVVLTFQRGNDVPFTQEWVFHRKKM
jgi:hypothetical protein